MFEGALYQIIHYPEDNLLNQLRSDPLDRDFSSG